MQLLATLSYLPQVAHDSFLTRLAEKGLTRQTAALQRARVGMPQQQWEHEVGKGYLVWRNAGQQGYQSTGQSGQLG